MGTKLRELTRSRLKAISSNLSYESLSQCFPEMTNSTKFQNLLRKVVENFQSKVDSGLVNAVNDVYEESDLLNLIDQLESQIQHAKERQSANPEALNAVDKPVHLSQLTPENIIEANVNMSKEEHIDELQRRLDQFDSVNAFLTTELEQVEADFAAECAKLGISVSNADAMLTLTSSLPSAKDLQARFA